MNCLIDSLNVFSLWTWKTDETEIKAQFQKRKKLNELNLQHFYYAFQKKRNNCEQHAIVMISGNFKFSKWKLLFNYKFSRQIFNFLYWNFQWRMGETRHFTFHKIFFDYYRDPFRNIFMFVFKLFPSHGTKTVLKLRVANASKY